MDSNSSHTDTVRRQADVIGQHVIDEYLSDHISRRDFINRAALVGIALPSITIILSACSGGASASGPSASAEGSKDARIRAGVIAPTATPNPLLVNDLGSIQMLSLVGETLVAFDERNTALPMLATKWASNDDGSIWTFTIRRGVKFSDGSDMTVDDVVYSVRTQCDPKNSPNDLSLFGGILEPSGVVRLDQDRIEFRLKAPYGAFPTAVSTSNYNLIVVPKGTDYLRWSQSFLGTGPFKVQSFNRANGAVFVRNPYYSRSKAYPQQIDLTFYADEQPMTAALQSGDIDCVGQFTVANSPQLLNGSYNIVNVKGSSHRALSLRNDAPNLSNKLVRQAIALTLDRPGIKTALFKGYADLGNDSPFAPAFPQTDKSIPQRETNVKQAKELMAQAGLERGFACDLYTEKLQELPQLAQIIKQTASEIGVDVRLNVETIAGYYGDAVFGKSDWLDGAMSLVDYGARPVPNVFLQAPLQTTNSAANQGQWNAAHFSNAEYDKLARAYIAAVDLSSQRRLATSIQRLLLDETPVVVPYFFDHLAASQRNIHGLRTPTGGPIDFSRVTKE